MLSPDETMKNQLAIAATVTVLLLTLGAFAAVLWTVWPRDTAPVAVSPDLFTPVDIGQAKPPSFVGPQLPENAGDAEEKSEEPTRSPKLLPRVKTTKQEPVPTPPAPERKRIRYKPAVLQVVTNFEAADVKVNGLTYPEYYEPGEPEGMVLPAGGPYNVEVKFGNNTKYYNLHLRPHETRLLIVELSGLNSSAPPPPAVKKAPAAKKEEPAPAEKKEDGDETGGKITVYSKPAGTVIVDGKETGEKTPGTVDLDVGRHEVQVKYETGTVSEKKIVRVRKGSRIKLFFRERTN